MDTEQTVHALLHGQPLCEFSSAVPAEWPAGHVWTQIEDIENINCSFCKQRARELLERNK